MYQQITKEFKIYSPIGNQLQNTQNAGIIRTNAFSNNENINSEREKNVRLGKHMTSLAIHTLQKKKINSRVWKLSDFLNQRFQMTHFFEFSFWKKLITKAIIITNTLDKSHDSATQRCLVEFKERLVMCVYISILMLDEKFEHCSWLVNNFSGEVEAALDGTATVDSLIEYISDYSYLISFLWICHNYQLLGRTWFHKINCSIEPYPFTLSIVHRDCIWILLRSFEASKSIFFQRLVLLKKSDWTILIFPMT